MKAFFVNTECKSREELSHPEWIRLTTYVNKIQPNTLLLHKDEESVRIEKPELWNGEGSVFIKPYRRPYAVELQRISLTSYITRIHKMKWNGQVLTILEVASLSLKDAVQWARTFMEVITQNWQDVAFRIANEIQAVDFMVDQSLTYMKFRVLNADEPQAQKLNSIKARRMAEKMFLPCMVKFSTVVEKKGDSDVTEIKVVFR